MSWRSDGGERELRILMPGIIWHCSRNVLWEKDTRKGKIWTRMESTGERAGHVTNLEIKARCGRNGTKNKLEGSITGIELLMRF